ncbi:MAG: VRR-NUC domain-containing protein [Deltaproteobacteria bacterium]|nr:VRR-NUC domain-containing protein [Deltaproteobacteria bacterium]
MPPANYYLNYFLEMIDTVVQRYGDILHDDDWSFVNRFKDANEQAQRLLVRLLLRKGPLFLVDTLQYAEVPSIEMALVELETKGLLERNPPVRAFDVIHLLPVAQSKPLFTDGDRNTRKRDLQSCFEPDTEEKPPADWGCRREIIRPAFRDAVRRLNLLYFGNEHQSLTEFVLEDIGMMRFETVPLSPSNRLFSDDREVSMYIHLNDLRAAFHHMTQCRQFDFLPSLAESLLVIHQGELLKSRFAKVANQVAYRLEQLGMVDLAARLFATNDLPPSRERQCRIAFKQHRFNDAQTILEAIFKSPLCADETAFHRRFAPRVYKKTNQPVPQVPILKIKERHETWQQESGTVEEVTCAHIDGAIWRENHLPLGIFGLIFWSVIFADVQGVWHHRFQSAPSDLNEPYFRYRRASLIEDTLNQSHSVWRNRIVTNWNKKKGIQNPFVHWNTLAIEELLSCFDAFSQAQWRGVFAHLLSDIPNHRSGFPDLFVRDENGGRFIEVKGPGDRLRDNQNRWLEVFEQLGIKVEVCMVHFAEKCPTPEG